MVVCSSHALVRPSGDVPPPRPQSAIPNYARIARDQMAQQNELRAAADRLYQASLHGVVAAGTETTGDAAAELDESWQAMMALVAMDQAYADEQRQVKRSIHLPSSGCRARTAEARSTCGGVRLAGSPRAAPHDGGGGGATSGVRIKRGSAVTSENVTMYNELDSHTELLFGDLLAGGAAMRSEHSAARDGSSVSCDAAQAMHSASGRASHLDLQPSDTRPGTGALGSGRAGSARPRAAQAALDSRGSARPVVSGHPRRPRTALARVVHAAHLSHDLSASASLASAAQSARGAAPAACSGAAGGASFVRAGAGHGAGGASRPRCLSARPHPQPCAQAACGGGRGVAMRISSFSQAAEAQAAAGVLARGTAGGGRSPCASARRSVDVQSAGLASRDAGHAATRDSAATPVCAAARGRGHTNCCPPPPSCVHAAAGAIACPTAHPASYFGAAPAPAHAACASTAACGTWAPAEQVRADVLRHSLEPVPTADGPADHRSPRALRPGVSAGARVPSAAERAWRPVLPSHTAAHPAPRSSFNQLAACTAGGGPALGAAGADGAGVYRAGVITVLPAHEGTVPPPPTDPPPARPRRNKWSL